MLAPEARSFGHWPHPRGRARHDLHEAQPDRRCERRIGGGIGGDRRIASGAAGRQSAADGRQRGARFPFADRARRQDNGDVALPVFFVCASEFLDERGAARIDLAAPADDQKINVSGPAPILWDAWRACRPEQ